MNISYRSKKPEERILSNLAATPFSIIINDELFRCQSVEGFWQGLKCKGAMREHVFQMSGLAAKRAGRNKSGRVFEIAGQRIVVGSDEHENLIREAIKQKILQNPRAASALRKSTGRITHRVAGRSKPIFKVDLMLLQIRKELWGR